MIWILIKKCDNFHTQTLGFWILLRNMMLTNLDFRGEKKNGENKSFLSGVIFGKLNKSVYVLRFKHQKEQNLISEVFAC